MAVQDRTLPDSPQAQGLGASSMDPVTLMAIGTAVGTGLNYLGDQQQSRIAGQQRNRETALQKEFAQNGLRWKVEDARRAGIHPLAALGATGASYSPVSVGDTGGGTAMSNLGQNLTRAVSATRTQEERQSASLALIASQKQIEGLDLDNQIKASQLRQMNTSAPAFPGSETFIPGQGNSGLIKNQPLQRTGAMPGASHSEPGAVVDVGWAATPTGLVPVPSKDFKERAEDMMVPEIMHSIRNNLMPNFGGGSKPPVPGDWEWSFWNQEYQPVDYKSESFFERAIDAITGRSMKTYLENQPRRSKLPGYKTYKRKGGQR